MLTTLLFGVLFKQLVCSYKFLYPEESFGPMLVYQKHNKFQIFINERRMCRSVQSMHAGSKMNYKFTNCLLVFSLTPKSVPRLP